MTGELVLGEALDMRALVATDAVGGVGSTGSTGNSSCNTTCIAASVSAVVGHISRANHRASIMWRTMLARSATPVALFRLKAV